MPVQSTPTPSTSQRHWDPPRHVKVLPCPLRFSKAGFRSGSVRGFPPSLFPAALYSSQFPARTFFFFIIHTEFLNLMVQWWGRGQGTRAEISESMRPPPSPTPSRRRHHHHVGIFLSPSPGLCLCLQPKDASSCVCVCGGGSFSSEDGEMGRWGRGRRWTLRMGSLVDENTRLEIGSWILRCFWLGSSRQEASVLFILRLRSHFCGPTRQIGKIPE